MRRFEFEGLIGFDVGEVVGFDCGDRSLGCCNYFFPSCNIAPKVPCHDCLFYLHNLDTYRRWEAAGCPIAQEGGEG